MQVILKCPLRASPSSPASPNTSWRCTARLWTGGSQQRRKSSEKRQELTQTTYDTEMYDEYEQFYILWNKYCWNVKLLSSALFHYICHLQSLTQLSESDLKVHFIMFLIWPAIRRWQCLEWNALPEKTFRPNSNRKLSAKRITNITESDLDTTSQF